MFSSQAGVPTFQEAPHRQQSSRTTWSTPSPRSTASPPPRSSSGTRSSRASSPSPRASSSTASRRTLTSTTSPSPTPSWPSLTGWTRAARPGPSGSASRLRTTLTPPSWPSTPSSRGTSTKRRLLHQTNGSFSTLRVGENEKIKILTKRKIKTNIKNHSRKKKIIPKCTVQCTFSLSMESTALSSGIKNNNRCHYLLSFGLWNVEMPTKVRTYRSYIWCSRLMGHIAERYF